MQAEPQTAIAAAFKKAGRKAPPDALDITARAAILEANWDLATAAAAVLADIDPEGLSRKVIALVAAGMLESGVKVLLQRTAQKMRAEQAPKNAASEKSGTAAAGTGHVRAGTPIASARPAATHQPSIPRAPLAGLKLIARSVLDSVIINGIALGDMTVSEGWACATHLRGRAKADNGKAKLIELMLSGLPPSNETAIRHLITHEEADKRAKLAEADDNA